VTSSPIVHIIMDDTVSGIASIEVISTTGVVYVRNKIDRGIAHRALAITQGRRPNDVWKYLGHMNRKYNSNKEGVNHD